ncbi:bifunctional adenosylcobinamide kinase/adenosylcobinamide-phosphate guanylyltransferase [Wohlfahrtiimonas populi]|uniref:bifunctional adenosylcobinamide kinase/adenosylcobinamide-phosphate guanylyltransferase n=1 Tax=Wohlfahrtiimonas populi TaxID=1940240 RepID=UPI00098D4E17|nr:bifunctional adenosylcobinamide kinase/adenosylcobinamide-phosphate guanylyltransferase [Wohlfahrtiimonas populi]
MERKITLITGGQRSGKSSFAERYALSLSDSPVYMATSRVWDDDYLQRIQRHQKDRGDQWQNIEEEKHLSQHSLNHSVIVIDCVTLWTTNFFFDQSEDSLDDIFQAVLAEFQKFTQNNNHYIFVTNEIGLGGISIDPIQRRFTDLLGWINQAIAKQADNVTFMVSGLPMQLKGKL